ncbi:MULTISPECIES: hypothetical protein [Methylophaga]|jgi:hypothetical protein|uniref:hypothetical protein n=1 Tax=Methylophaga TaxID=40222 RepID=UPI000CDCCE94|nr:hypothetical protein [Methylophaga nitratireducenticrescens]AUZ86151.1 hypothetical protein CDW43_15990 [Methylophaga nitratireducenticrescens]
MKFERYTDYSYEVTNRKKAAVIRKQKKEVENYPLFADEVREEQKSVDAIMDDRIRYWTQHNIRERSRRAKGWIEARKRLRAYPEAIKDKLYQYWNNNKWYPKTPIYLHGMMDMYDRETLKLD